MQEVLVNYSRRSCLFGEELENSGKTDEKGKVKRVSKLTPYFHPLGALRDLRRVVSKLAQ